MAEPTFVFDEVYVYILPIVASNFNDIFAYDECHRNTVVNLRFVLHCGKRADSIGTKLSSACRGRANADDANG